MKLSIFGKELVIGEKDKNGKKVVIGIIDVDTGKGSGVYEDLCPTFER